MKFLRSFFLLVLSLTFSACSASLNSLIGVPTIQLKKAAQTVSGEPEVKIDPIVDARANDTVAALSTKEAKIQGDILAAIQTATENAFKAHGFTLSAEAPLVVKTQLKTLFADIADNKVSTTASISLEVQDPANRRVYSAHYDGSVNLEASGINSDDVKRSLGIALGEAIDAMFADQRLVRLLSSF